MCFGFFVRLRNFLSSLLTSFCICLLGFLVFRTLDENRFFSHHAQKKAQIGRIPKNHLKWKKNYLIWNFYGEQHKRVKFSPSENWKVHAMTRDASSRKVEIWGKKSFDFELERLFRLTQAMVEPFLIRIQIKTLLQLTRSVYW